MYYFWTYFGSPKFWNISFLHYFTALLIIGIYFSLYFIRESKKIRIFYMENKIKSVKMFHFGVFQFGVMHCIYCMVKSILNNTWKIPENPQIHAIMVNDWLQEIATSDKPRNKHIAPKRICRLIRSLSDKNPHGSRKINSVIPIIIISWAAWTSLLSNLSTASGTMYKIPPKCLNKIYWNSNIQHVCRHTHNLAKVEKSGK